MKIIVTLLFCLPFCLAAQTIETDRPDQTESSSSVPKGTIQIESGLSYETVNYNFATVKNHAFTLPTSLFRIALCNKFELRVVNTFKIEEFQSGGLKSRDIGMDDLELGYKWQFNEGHKLVPQVALMTHVVLPTGSKSHKTYGLVNKLLIAHDLTDKISLGYNIGLTNFGHGNNDFVYSIAIGFAISDNFGLYVENYGKYNAFKSFDSNCDAGITYLIRDHIQLDYSFGIGITQRMNYQAIGISMRFPKLN